MKPERTETIYISMELKGSAYEKHKEAIHTLCPDHTTNVQQDDRIKISYTFWATYHGLVENLQAVEELCGDPDTITSVDCAALEERRILVYEVLKKLDSVIQKVKHK
jgi:hypothetical protein